MRWKFFFLSALLAFPAFPQTFQQLQYELGADIGYGIYRNGTILSPEGSINAGIRNRFAAGITLGADFSDYVSGEFNFLYHDGHPFLQGLGVKTDIQGNSWALTGSLLFYFKNRAHKLRPFVSGGVGGKGYFIAGPAPFPQPIPQVASLTTNDVWKVVLVPGAGVKYRIHRKVILRGEFRDYLTTFPRTQIFPAPHNTARGIFEQLTPLFGVSYVF
ncbi:MAG TPA: outer membrane beta-barrel protein [Bryobacteraceae bacterium]|nr:outer membrane beta-barrel protein [Bryobacteraceae bacterium]